MASPNPVAHHYGNGGIAERVLAALRDASGPDAPVTPGSAGADRPFPRPRRARDRGAGRAAQAGARRAPPRYRQRGRRAGALDRGEMRLSCDRRRPDPGILRGGAGAKRGLRHEWPGDDPGRQRARPSGAGRRVRPRLFAERHYEHRRQAALLSRGVPRAAAGRNARPVKCVRRRAASRTSRCRGRRRAIQASW